MNATKLYVLCKALCNIALTAGITIAACYLRCWALLFFLILPACGMSMEVKSDDRQSSVNDQSGKENENDPKI